MLYPVYVYLGDGQHAHGAVIPDFPGCFPGADEWEDLPRMIQEAVEVYFEGEDMEIPAPSPLEQVALDPEYVGGVWMLVDIDLTKVSTKSVRVNISLPANLVSKIDSYAQSHHMSRSGFIAKAAEEVLRHGKAA